MSLDLNEIRKEIDEIDAGIVDLYEKRMNLCKNVAKYKIENNIPILDSSRELVILEKNLAKIKNPEYRKYYDTVLKGYLTASKDMQKDIIEKK